MPKLLYGHFGPFPAPRVHPLRHGAARALQLASRVLARLAWQLGRTPRRRRPASEPMLEFHAEAGAPEGALYVDGELVGLLPGVRRL